MSTSGSNCWDTIQPTKDTQTGHHLFAAPNLGNQQLHNAWVCKSTQVTKLISLSGEDLPRNTAHDLARACLRQVIDKVDFLRCRKGADNLAHLEGELFLDDPWVRGVVLEFTGVLVSRREIIRHGNTYGLSVTKAWTAWPVNSSGVPIA